MKASNSTSRHTFPASGSSSPRSMPINKFSSLCPLLGLGPADGAFYPSSPLSHTHTLQQRPPHPPIPTSARSRAPCSCPISSALVWKFPTPTGPEACHTHPHLCPLPLCQQPSKDTAHCWEGLVITCPKRLVPRTSRPSRRGDKGPGSLSQAASSPGGRQAPLPKGRK